MSNKRISISSPLRRGSSDGFWQGTTTSLATAKSNLRNILLTSPGERIMRPRFGLSPRKYLFENRFPMEAYKDEIHAQVSEYLPYINVNKIVIEQHEDNPSISVGNVKVFLAFSLRDFESQEDFIEHLF
jgi:phage baseplate assembly protein W